MVVAIETGGRWSDEVADFLWQLALAEAWEVPALLIHSAAFCLGKQVDADAQDSVCLCFRGVGGVQ